MIFVALAMAALVIGLNLGGSLTPSTSGVSHITLTPLPENPSTPQSAVPAQSAVRMVDGHIALFRREYGDFLLDGGRLIQIERLLRQADSWADIYPIEGGDPEQRWELRLFGTTPRRILIDNPLANRNLPESLYQLIIVTLRPSLQAAPDPFIPTSMILRVVPIPVGEDLGGEKVITPPDGLDMRAAGSDAGQIVTGTTLDALDAQMSVRRLLQLGQNHVIIKLPDGSVGRLFWGVDWAAW